MNKRVIALPFLSIVGLIIVGLTMQIAYASGTLTPREANLLRGGCKKMCVVGCGQTTSCNSGTCVSGSDCGAFDIPDPTQRCDTYLWNDPNAHCSTVLSDCAATTTTCKCEPFGDKRLCFPHGTTSTQQGQPPYFSCYTTSL